MPMGVWEEGMLPEMREDCARPAPAVCAPPPVSYVDAAPQGFVVIRPVLLTDRAVESLMSPRVYECVYECQEIDVRAGCDLRVC